MNDTQATEALHAHIDHLRRQLAEKQAEVDAAKLERDAADTRAVMWETGAKELDARLRRCETDNNRCHANITAERQRAERAEARLDLLGAYLDMGDADSIRSAIMAWQDDAALAARPEEGK